MIALTPVFPLGKSENLTDNLRELTQHSQPGQIRPPHLGPERVREPENSSHIPEIYPHHPNTIRRHLRPYQGLDPSFLPSPRRKSCFLDISMGDMGQHMLYYRVYYRLPLDALPRLPAYCGVLGTR
jgi:hypothetical protein